MFSHRRISHHSRTMSRVASEGGRNASDFDEGSNHTLPSDFGHLADLADDRSDRPDDDHFDKMIDRAAQDYRSLLQNAFSQIRSNIPPTITVSERSLMASKMCREFIDKNNDLIRSSVLNLRKDFQPCERISHISREAMQSKIHSSPEQMSSSGAPENIEQVSTLGPNEWQKKLFESLPHITFGNQGTVTVWGSVYVSPSEFYVHLDWSMLCKLSFLMASSCHAIAKNHKMTPSDLKIGMVIAAKYTDDRWYRGMVKSIGDATYKIFYLDYGNTSDVQIEDIIPLPHCVQDIPIQAVKCCVSGYDKAFHGTFDEIIRVEMDDHGSFESRKLTLELIQLKEQAMHPDSNAVGLFSLPVYSVDVVINGKSLVEELNAAFERALAEKFRTQILLNE